MAKQIEVLDTYTYMANAGDTFDLLAFREYGDEHLMSLLIQQNLKYADVLIFEGGEELEIPFINIQEFEESLPPWRQGEQEE